MNEQSKKTLLLVDDEEVFREVSTSVLSRRGFTVLQADSGERALEILRTTTPDLVLLDLRMLGMDGVETLKELRQNDPQLPVIILTGHGNLDDAMAGLKLDIVDFLQKPVDMELLSTRIHEVLNAETPAPLREKTIGELMAPASAYQRVYVDQTLQEAFGLMRDGFFDTRADQMTRPGRRTLSVYDRNERFRGLLRVNDIIRSLIPPIFIRSPYSSYFTGMFLAQAELTGRRPIEELVDRQPTIEIRAPLMKAVHRMVLHGVINLPVLEDGQLMGVLRDIDILWELAGLTRGLESTQVP